MAAASASAESNAAELLHMGKLANGKSVNTEASSVLSTSRMLAGCLLTQAECLALLQRIDSSKPKSKSSDENKAIKTLFHIIHVACLSHNVQPKQGVLDQFQQTCSNTKYRHAVPALLKVCSVAGLHGTALASARSMHSALRQAQSSLPLDQQSPPPKSRGFIATVPSILLALAHCSGCDATLASMLHDCLPHAFLRQPAVFAAAAQAMLLESSAAHTERPVFDVMRAFFFEEGSLPLRSSACAVLRGASGSSALVALQRFAVGGAFIAPCSSSTAHAFITGQLQSRSSVGLSPTAAQGALLWGATHGSERVQRLALQACAALDCWNNTQVYFRCIALLEKHCSELQQASVPSASVTGATHRVLTRTGVLLLGCDAASSPVAHTLPQHFVSLVLSALRDAEVSGRQFEECCLAALLLASSLHSHKVVVELQAAVVGAICKEPLSRAPLALDVCTRMLGSSRLASRPAAQLCAARLLAVCLASYAAYVPLHKAQNTLSIVLSFPQCSQLVPAAILRAIGRRQAGGSSAWVLGTEAIPSGFGVLSLPQSSSTFPVKPFVLSFLSPECSEGSSAGAAVHATARAVLQHVKEHTQLCARDAVVSAAVERGLGDASVALDDIRVLVAALEA